MTDWTLAIDFGTSFTAAAVNRGGRPEALDVAGERRVPSIVVVDDDGKSLVVGQVAASLVTSKPGRALREPKRRLGEPAPVVLGGHPWPVTELVAAILRHVLDEAIRQEGSDPAEVRLTYPATWSRPRRAELVRAAEIAGVRDPVLVAEPVAAAVEFAAVADPEGDILVAVYDLGGGTFDTAILRGSLAGFEIVGRPSGDARLGGELFDELLLNRVTAQLGKEAADALQTSDEIEWAQAAAALRNEVRRAKEALSVRDEVDLLVALPTGITSARITRAELEETVAPHLTETIELLRESLLHASLTPSDLDAVFLVGGASRMPLVARLLADAFPGVEVSLRSDPKLAVAMGASRPEAVAAAAAVVSPTPTPANSTERGRTIEGTDSEGPVPNVAPKPETVAGLIPTAGPSRARETVASFAAAGGPARAGETIADVAGLDRTPKVLERVLKSWNPSDKPLWRRPVVLGVLTLVLLVTSAGIRFVTDQDAPSTHNDPFDEIGHGVSQDEEAEVAATHAFAEERTEWGADLARVWKFDGKDLSAELTFSNASGSEITGTYVEVIPKSVAASVDLIAFSPQPTKIIDPDPIVEFTLSVPANGSTSVLYSAAVADADGSEPPSATIARIQSDWADAVSDYQQKANVRDTVPPGLTVLNPAPGATVRTASIVLSGLVERGANLTINGQPVGVDAAGQWRHEVTLSPGANSFSLVAVDPAGNPSSATLGVIYRKPSDTTTNPPPAVTPPPPPPPGDSTPPAPTNPPPSDPPPPAPEPEPDAPATSEELKEELYNFSASIDWNYCDFYEGSGWPVASVTCGWSDGWAEFSRWNNTEDMFDFYDYYVANYSGVERNFTYDGVVVGSTFEFIDENGFATFVWTWDSQLKSGFAQRYDSDQAALNDYWRCCGAVQRG